MGGRIIGRERWPTYFCTVSKLTHSVCLSQVMIVAPAITVNEALAQFYQEHDFGQEGGIYEKWAYFKIGLITIPIPNTKERREMIYLHDLNHIVNGYETTWRGESMVSIWEFTTGGWGYRPMIWGLIFSAMSIGFVLYPRAVFGAFMRGQYTRSLWSLGLSKQALLALTIPDLKRQLGMEVGTSYPVRAVHRWQFALLYMVSLAFWISFGIGILWGICLFF